jgi:diguanylate cyclase (GGDEF)-like protein
MRFPGRHDLFLLVGLSAALLVSVAHPIGRVVAYAREIDAALGLQLLPALVILATVFTLVQFWKRRQERLAALGAAADARHATERLAEMQRLVSLGQALARSLDEDAIRAAASAHLALLAPGRGVWALVRKGPQWKALAVVGDSSTGERERAAQRALGDVDLAHDAVAAAAICFPMVSAGTPVGVLGVSPTPPLTDHQRSVLAAAAALFAVSLKNAELFREVHENSVRDALTGCFNRKHALEVMDAELRRARRSQMPVSLLMFDLDHFKAINDSFGHLCGDAVLAAVGSRMKSVLRGSDLKCRYGGEEFLVLLPDTPLAGARRVAETLRREIADHPVPWNDTTIAVSASFGVTAVNAGEVDPLAIMSRADAALYRAKQDGRNCVGVHEDVPAASAAVLS